MSLLDTLRNASGSALSAAHNAALAKATTEVLDQQHSGLGGLVEKFTEAGLGHVASSWVGGGANLPVSPEQLQQVLGSDVVKQIAVKAGISPEMVNTGLSVLLPILVDKATPQGQVPAGGGSLASGLGALLSMFAARNN